MNELPRPAAGAPPSTAREFEGSTLLEALRTAARELDVSGIGELHYALDAGAYRLGRAGVVVKAWALEVPGAVRQARDYLAGALKHLGVDGKVTAAQKGETWRLELHTADPPGDETLQALRRMVTECFGEGIEVEPRAASEDHNDRAPNRPRREHERGGGREGGREGRRDGRPREDRGRGDRDRGRGDRGRGGRGREDRERNSDDRDERLLADARAAVAQAIETRQAVRLPAMNSFARRLVHQEVMRHPGVVSRSAGEGPQRSVEILPDESGASED